MPENVSPPSLNDQSQEDKKPRFNLYTWLFDNPERFFWVIVSLGLIGGLAALMVPNCIDWQISSNDSADTKAEEIRQKSISDLRLHILYITGGIIAILTLLQNSWKNQIDRRKIEDDIQKNKNDHVRQVHAERRSRYTKAVEQLGDEKAAVRLGGIYTLVSIVDEWLTDPDVDIIAGKKEGQVIINNLCSYIRSPFPLAENKYFLEKKNLTDNEFKKYNGNFKDDQKKLQEEKDIRRAILNEIKYRCSASLALVEDGDESVYTEFWPSFVYDFSYANFFYPVYLNDVFFKATVNFADATFKDYTTFSGSMFLNHVSFSSATFEGELDFSQTNFESPVYFDEAIFHNVSIFEESLFSKSDFSRAKFNNITSFRGSFFDETAVFNKTIFTNVDFSDTSFKENTHFENTTFKGSAFFDGSTIASSVDSDPS